VKTVMFEHCEYLSVIIIVICYCFCPIQLWFSIICWYSEDIIIESVCFSNFYMFCYCAQLQVSMLMLTTLQWWSIYKYFTSCWLFHYRNS